MRTILGAPRIEIRMRGGIQPQRQATLLEATPVVTKAEFFRFLDDTHPVRSVAYWDMGRAWRFVAGNTRPIDVMAELGLLRRAWGAVLINSRPQTLQAWNEEMLSLDSRHTADRRHGQQRLALRGAAQSTAMDAPAGSVD